MKEQLISYETAVMAKQKGFIIEQDNHYARLPKGEWKFYENDISNHPKFYESAEVLEAPTQSLLQKWLREVHKKYVAVYPIIHHWQVDVRDCDMSKRVHSCPPQKELRDKYFDTYEEALEAGLKEALKLIK